MESESRDYIYQLIKTQIYLKPFKDSRARLPFDTLFTRSKLFLMSFDLLNKVAKSFTLLKNTSFDHRFDLVKFHLTTISQTKPVMASSRGLVVKAEDS
jgi:hypothetical protein